jgi:hypothetical protein
VRGAPPEPFESVATLDNLIDSYARLFQGALQQLPYE